MPPKGHNWIASNKQNLHFLIELTIRLRRQQQLQYYSNKHAQICSIFAHSHLWTLCNPTRLHLTRQVNEDDTGLLALCCSEINLIQSHSQTMFAIVCWAAHINHDLWPAQIPWNFSRFNVSNCEEITQLKPWVAMPILPMQSHSWWWPLYSCDCRRLDAHALARRSVKLARAEQSCQKCLAKRTLCCPLAISHLLACSLGLLGPSEHQRWSRKPRIWHPQRIERACSRERALARRFAKIHIQLHALTLAGPVRSLEACLGCKRLNLPSKHW